MTTLVMVQTADDVILGWDSQITRANELNQMMNPKFFVNNGVAIGVAGIARAADIFEVADLPNPYDLDWADGRKWMISEWIPALEKVMEAHPILKDDDGDPAFSLMVAFRGKAYDVDSALSVCQYAEGIYTQGSGGDYARGVLFGDMIRRHLSVDDVPPLGESNVRVALTAAVRCDPGSGGQVRVVRASEYIEEATK